MTDKEAVLTLTVTPEERERIEDLARRRGYAAPGDYLLALVEMDSYELEEEEDVDLVSNFKQSWHEAMTGQIHPIETLWDDLDDE